MGHSVTEVIDGQKMCADCLVTQPLENFTPQRNGLGGRAAQCRPCRNAKQRGFYLTPEQRRKHSLKKCYGITPEQFDDLANEQDGQCQICGKVPEKVLHQDHDHGNGFNRSLLCAGCNAGMGMFGDDPEIMLKAVSYLRFWNEVFSLVEPCPE